MWENLGRVMAETMQIDRLIAEPDRIQLEPHTAHFFARYQGKMGAAVGVSLHMGNWELAAWPMTQMGNNPAAVYRSVNNPYVDRYLSSLRRNLYPGGLLGKGRINGSAEEGQRTARLITDYVRKGGRLGMVCDLLRPHRHSGAVRQAGAVGGDCRHDRARAGWVPAALRPPAPGEVEPVLDRAQGAQGAPHRQSGRGRGGSPPPCAAGSRNGSARRRSSGCGATGGRQLGLAGRAVGRIARRDPILSSGASVYFLFGSGSVSSDRHHPSTSAPAFRISSSFQSSSCCFLSS